MPKLTKAKDMKTRFAETLANYTPVTSDDCMELSKYEEGKFKKILIISNEEYTKLADKSNLEVQDTLYFYADRFKFFNLNFKNVACTLSRIEFINLDTSWTLEFDDVAFCKLTVPFDTETLVCVPSEEGPMIVYRVKASTVSTFIPPTIDDFGAILKEVGGLIDAGNLIAISDDQDDCRYIDTPTDESTLEVYNRFDKVINAFFITLSGKPDYAKINEVKSTYPEYDIRIYPTDQDSFGWLVGCFDFSYNGKRYKMSFG